MDPFLGEIRVFGFNYAPKGWAFCAGQTLQISQFPALYSLLGTQFGGDGRTSFGVPNFQGKVGVGQGQGPGLSGYQMGSQAGATSVTLTLSQLGAHNHTLNASAASGLQSTANGDVLAVAVVGGRGQPQNIGMIYSNNPGAATTPLNAASITSAGDGSSHNNMQPSVTLNYCICLNGIFPSRP